jgi:histidinol dehydrogenase
MAMRLLQLDDSTDRQTLDGLITRLREATCGVGEMAQTVRRIVEDVRANGDQALVGYMRRFTMPEATAADIAVPPGRLAEAAEAMPADLREAFSRSIEHVRAYQSHIMPADPPMMELDDAQLGLRFVPIQRVGLTVPGGKAAYPSTLIMSAVPAQVAGVSELAVCCPPPNRPTDAAQADRPAEVSSLVLGVCHMLGIDRVYRVGGAEAVAAMAFGTQTIRPVDFIAGPGTFSQLAKRIVFGTVGIDGLLGPSEIVVLADASANPAWVAADLLAQAEHDPGSCFLVSRDRAVIEAILREVQRQLPQRRRRDAIEQSLRDWCAAIVAPDDQAAEALVDELAAEHVLLAVADPQATLGRLRHGGAWFLGAGSPVASGDYYAGPSHCLPTGTTARFTSGLSVYSFLKRSSVEHYPTRPNDRAIEHIAALAEAEGLDAHAASVRARSKG